LTRTVWNAGYAQGHDDGVAATIKVKEKNHADLLDREQVCRAHEQALAVLAMQSFLAPEVAAGMIEHYDTVRLARQRARRAANKHAVIAYLEQKLAEVKAVKEYGGCDYWRLGEHGESFIVHDPPVEANGKPRLF